jgi:hypothetical protein
MCKEAIIQNDSMQHTRNQANNMDDTGKMMEKLRRNNGKWKRHRELRV